MDPLGPRADNSLMHPTFKGAAVETLLVLQLQLLIVSILDSSYESQRVAFSNLNVWTSYGTSRFLVEMD